MGIVANASAAAPATADIESRTYSLLHRCDRWNVAICRLLTVGYNGKTLGFLHEHGESLALQLAVVGLPERIASTIGRLITDKCPKRPNHGYEWPVIDGGGMTFAQCSGKDSQVGVRVSFRVFRARPYHSTMASYRVPSFIRLTLLDRPDATALLRDVACPTMIVCGRDDKWSPLAHHEEMHAQIRGSELRVIERSGHMCTMERPDDVTEALVKWARWAAGFDTAR
ncbi:alpha/beta fold hydrolase [Paraburkholderia sp. CI3]|uniref:alpha/beta fold hydrolase n=1 Tax=Paraburkholderia sp. CI3 TaxID=2991060 RepID=UPI003D1CB941